MGFTTGFTGGVTLTLGVAYLAVLAHERHRQGQAQALRSQARVLNGLFDPTPLPPPQSRAELAREERGTLVETAKDRWNAEIENAVRWVQRKDWDGVRIGMEDSVARLLGTGLEKSRDGIEEAEKQAGPKVQEAVDRSRAVARKSAEQAATSIDQAAAATISGAERVVTSTKEQLSKAGADLGAKSAQLSNVAKAKADRAVVTTKEELRKAGTKSAEVRDAAKVKADRVVADTKSGAHDAVDKIKQSGGTIDAARGTVRDVVSKGIEKGKEAIGKAQVAVGLATDKLESTSQSAGLFYSSPVEKALHERYERPDGLNKSVKEVLDERYKPIDARDNTVLRGV